MMLKKVGALLMGWACGAAMADPYVQIDKFAALDAGSIQVEGGEIRYMLVMPHAEGPERRNALVRLLDCKQQRTRDVRILVLATEGGHVLEELPPPTEGTRKAEEGSAIERLHVALCKGQRSPAELEAMLKPSEKPAEKAVEKPVEKQ
ncbi:hypothetical protein N8I74_15700 [Chitiniphilus purpureus]|uniref:Uncharacterized protein n=1 Tax=Chitiniphilus purpureus TaxID=2981137 RepID=A0ABY6DKI1_9NEIS|nr:hypothetical protein [Chitiniphilus sp. CD1]UXY14748.1 hypothetical protein N8I74_15700 [Chitiniphilus sp. CD1]